jgi:hypothetical protein
MIDMLNSSFTIERPASTEFAPYYGKYIEQVPEGDLFQLMADQSAALTDLLKDVDEAQAGYRYEPGKWSLKEVLGHVCDTERIFVYRALRISRSDQTPMPGMDQNLFVEGGNFDERTLVDLLEEFQAIRQSTLLFFKSLSSEMWDRTGTASDCPFTVRALGYITVGHELHHRKIIQERYLS